MRDIDYRSAAACKNRMIQEMAGERLCDDAVVEILVRLPSESVLRCRAVCKRWRRITTDRSFLAAHAARRPREMLIRTQSQTLSTMPMSLNPRPPDGKGRRGYLCDTIVRNENGITIGSFGLVASLDGLLVLRQGRGLYIICNPTTRQATTLPALVPAPCVSASACGFYFHASSGEYRLLCHGVDGEDWKDYYYVLSAGATKPRRLMRAPFEYGTGNPYERGYGSPVAHRGVLYWLCLHPKATREMLAYDTASETFRLMPRPPCDGLAALLELDGELCAAAAVHRDTMLHIWVMEDYEAGSWALRHQVVLPPSTKYFRAGDVGVSMAVSAGDGAILIGHPRLPPVVKLCDLRAKRMRREVEFLRLTPTMLLFSESLVPHAFFQSPCCSDLVPHLKYSD